MKKITLTVPDNNVETLLNILNNLKEGLITEISPNDLHVKTSTTYQPKTNKVILEEQSSNLQGKYANASLYKQRLSAKKKL